MNIIENLEKEQMRLDIPDFKPGDTIKVHARIKEGDKERIQVFQGAVIRRRKGTTGATFTVRKSFVRHWRGKDFSPTFTLN